METLITIFDVVATSSPFELAVGRMAGKRSARALFEKSRGAPAPHLASQSGRSESVHPGLFSRTFFFFVIIISQYNYIYMLMNYGNQPRDRSGVLRGRKSTEVQFHLRSANACRQARLADWPASQTASITAG